MNTSDFPDLYVAADKEAGRKQKHYFRLLLAQYFCLSVASSLTLLSSYVASHQLLVLGYLAVLLAGSVAALLLATMRPDQHWYQMRALAESCKTLSWRYMMAAEPFEHPADTAQATAKLAERLHELISLQNLNTAALLYDLDASEQATEKMKSVREADFEDRKAKYLADRIDNQSTWYKRKASRNKRASSLASTFVVLIYVAAIASTIWLFQEGKTDSALWYSEPLLVLAASFLGYAQAKRFSELSSSYALTALEIQKLRSGIKVIEDDGAFSAFVNEAESAFSREHTQWIARVV